VADRPETFRIDPPQRSDGAVRLAVVGELDAATAPELAEALRGLTAGSESQIVLDFAGLEFIDSAGLSVLVAAHGQLKDEGRQLVIDAARPAARRLFAISGLERVLTIL